MSDRGVAATGDRPPNNSMQRTALRAAADAERWTDRALTSAVTSRVVAPLPRRASRPVDGWL
jgi:hypothetical protein